jgi:hypothetical protein
VSGEVAEVVWIGDAAAVAVRIVARIAMRGFMVRFTDSSVVMGEKKTKRF